MSRLSHHGEKKTAEAKALTSTAVENFMGGTSYEVSPLNTLRIVAASSIFGEPQYYRDGEGSEKTVSREISNYHEILENSIFEDLFKDNKTAVEVFTAAIDNALEADFKGTLDLALRLRTEFMMRLNPSVIWMRASIHPKRAEFNEKNPGYMKEIGKKIVMRPDDITNQFDYYCYTNGSKNGLSSIVKRTWAENLESFSRYQLNKYKGKKLIDLVRISHANSENLNELLKTGTIKVEESEKTWENLKSDGKNWTEILSTIKMPHMALLRNLRGIFTEVSDTAVLNKVLVDLVAGVPNGKQFPFRYWSAFKAVENATDMNMPHQVMDALQVCIDVAIANFPKLKGKVMSLCDNSGSAHGSFNSEYGSVKVSEIANLSALITGAASEEGYVGVFGDKLEIKGVSKRDGLLTQLKATNKIGDGIGHSTENGIWLFWDQAIKTKEHWDTVFIYSDMQAGRGGLYGTDVKEYAEFIYKGGYGRHIDVLALVQKYRKEVNPKVNVFSVQVAGYNNSVLPENLYRGAILSGWTGKESLYALEIIESWNKIENVRD
jgi:hypothetical protein